MLLRMYSGLVHLERYTDLKQILQAPSLWPELPQQRDTEAIEELRQEHEEIRRTFASSLLEKAMLTTTGNNTTQHSLQPILPRPLTTHLRLRPEEANQREGVPRTSLVQRDDARRWN